jgi:NOL1/NOP2/sun family putative RNA methylase
LKGFEELDSIIFSPYVYDKNVLELSRRYGYEPSIVYRYVETLGYQGAVELLEANERPLPETIRCNDYLIDCNVLKSRLKGKGFKLRELPLAPHGFEVLEAPISIGATHEYLQGYYYIQDPGSMMVVYILDPKPGELIVDMAAAPGGKATQILQLTRDKARLVAVDISRRRMRALRSHMQRMGFTSYIAVRMDARLLPETIRADRVLLDAPSSGEGIIRKDPGRKRRGRVEDIKAVHELQLSLLEKAVKLVADGGVIVYAACSTAVEEGEYVVHKILETHGEIHVIEPNGKFRLSQGITYYRGVKLNPEVARCVRLWPHIHGTEGFFICKLLKTRK